MKRAVFVPLLTLQLACWVAAIASGQFEAFDIDHPAIRYRDAVPSGAIEQLNRRLRDGQTLSFEATGGYLKALLTTLDIPVESQLAMYSKTSLQSARISPQNPRVIFFNDSTAVAWVPGGFIEVAAHDPRQGAVFYLLNQALAPVPQLVRDERCLSCHLSTAAAGIPGFLVRSIPTAADGTIMPWLGNYATDHRSALRDRWGGWYVTANRVDGPHLGNAFIADPNARDLPRWTAERHLTTLEPRVTSGTYPAPYSDIVALLVFDHQARMMNLLTRIGWEARVLAEQSRTGAGELTATAKEAADYLLFVDEAPVGRVAGTSGFEARFTSRGPRDRQGRSLREFDLDGRLMRYPLSYMIYSEAFDALPAEAKNSIYRRLWEVLSGRDRSSTYAHLSDADRRATIEILLDTKPGLPPYFLEPVPRR